MQSRKFLLVLLITGLISYGAKCELKGLWPFGGEALTPVSKSFFDLSAKDIDGNEYKFSDMKGKMKA